MATKKGGKKAVPVRMELPPVRCTGWPEFWKAVGNAIGEPKDRAKKGARRG